MSNKATTKCQLQFDCENEPIVCTPEHPFYILNASDDTPIVRFEGKDETEGFGCWVAAKDLNVGNKCLLSDGKTGTITEVKTELCDEFTTYNFEVADYHTYYVGEQGILVHNACPVGPELPNEGTPNSSRMRFDTEGKIYSAKTYGADGRVTARIDFQGRTHAVIDLPGAPRIVPHVHPVVYDLGIYYRELKAVSLPFYINGL